MIIYKKIRIKFLKKLFAHNIWLVELWFRNNQSIKKSWFKSRLKSSLNLKLINCKISQKRIIIIKLSKLANYFYATILK